MSDANATGNANFLDVPMKQVFEKMNNNQAYRGQTFGGSRMQANNKTNTDIDNSSFGLSNSNSVDDFKMDRRANSRPKVATNLLGNNQTTGY